MLQRIVGGLVISFTTSGKCHVTELNIGGHY